MEHLARQLLADARGLSFSPNYPDQAIAASEKFPVPLTKLAGTSGFSSLLSRALALAKRRSISLAELRVEADGHLIVVKGDGQQLEISEADQRGAVILIVELLALLVVLIGEPVTLGLVREECSACRNGGFQRLAQLA